MGIKHYDRYEQTIDRSWFSDWSKLRTMHAPLLGFDENPIVFPNARKPQLGWYAVDGGRLVGLTGICDVDMKNSHCQLLFSFLDPDSLSQSLALVSTHVFNALGLRKIHCLLPADNLACGSVETFGFRQEALMRRHCLVNGKLTDIKWHGMIKE